jgi:hypothetical protein
MAHFFCARPSAGVVLEEMWVGVGEGVEFVVGELHDLEECGLEALHVSGAAYGDARAVGPDGPRAADHDVAVCECVGDRAAGTF